MTRDIATGFGITFLLTIACFITASALAVVTCAGFCSKNKLVRAIAKGYNGVIIKIPPLVMLMLFALLLTGDRNRGTLWVAYVGLSLFVASNLTGVFYGGVCSVSRGEIDAARTLGFTKKSTFFHVMLPQIIQNIVPVYMSMFVMCMDRWKIILSGFALTIKLSMLSFVLGTVLACVLCAGQVCRVKWINALVKAYNGLVNKIPHMVILMLLYYVVLADAAISAEAVAVIGLTMRIASTLSDNFVSVLRGVQKGKIEAARTLGMSAFQAFWNVTMPQVIRAVSPLYRIQFVLAVQMTSVVSVLSLMDLTRSVNVVAAYTFDPYIGVLVTTLVYILVGYIGDVLIGLFAKERHTYVKGGRAA